MSENEKIYGYSDGKSKVEVASKKYTDNALSARQLLVNNSFQVNQRGQSVYDYSSSKGFTLDCWHSNTLKVEILENGNIKITNTDTSPHGFSQNIKTNVDQSVACMEVVEYSGDCFLYAHWNEQHTEQIISENVSKNGLHVFNINKKIIQLGLSIPSGGYIVIKYIDLFEGEVAPPHVKKSYAEDLMECERFLQIVEISCTYNSSSLDSQNIFEYPIIKMIGTPTIKVLSTRSITGIKENTIGQDYSNGSIKLYFNSSNLGFNRINERKILLSCE